jgi:hypothetical protein
MTHHEQERPVGLGRVLEDHLSTGDEPADTRHPDAPPETPPDADESIDPSAQSFPASDPPATMSAPTTRDREPQPEHDDR